MRSRYTAYTTARIDYITETHDPRTRDSLNPEEARAWAEGVEWLGLEILATAAGGLEDSKGTVDFVARFKNEEGEQEHRERSTFVKRAESMVLRRRQASRSSDRAARLAQGRSQHPCPCGSGKKFKKCHGA